MRAASIGATARRYILSYPPLAAAILADSPLAFWPLNEDGTIRLGMAGPGMTITNSGRTMTRNALSSGSDYYSARSVQSLTGKQYIEFRNDADNGGSTGQHGIGIISGTLSAYDDSAAWVGDTSAGWGYYNDQGSVYTGGNVSSTGYPSANTVGDIIMFAYDQPSGKGWFGKNGTWFSSGDPAAGTNPTFTSSVTTWHLIVSSYVSGQQISILKASEQQYTAPSGFSKTWTPDVAYDESGSRQFGVYGGNVTAGSTSIINSSKSILVGTNSVATSFTVPDSSVVSFGSTPKTFGCVFKASGTGATVRVLMVKEQVGVNYPEMAIYLQTNGKIHAQLHSGNNATQYGGDSTNTFNDGLPHLLLLSWDGSTINMYIDNNLEMTASFTGPVWNGSDPFTIGASYAPSYDVRAWNGYISHAFILSGAISSARRAVYQHAMTAQPREQNRFLSIVIDSWKAAGNIDSQIDGGIQVNGLKYFVGTTEYPTVAMTSNTAPSPLVASATSALTGYGDLEPYRIFRGSLSGQGWQPTSNGAGYPQRLTLDLGAGNKIAPTSVQIAPAGAVNTNGGYYIISFRIQGSANGAWAGEEITYKTVTGLTAADWANNTFSTFKF